MAYASGMTDSPVKQAITSSWNAGHGGQPTFSRSAAFHQRGERAELLLDVRRDHPLHHGRQHAPAGNGTSLADGGSVTISGTTTLAAIACARGMIDSP
jgi:hypothetical protein